MKTLFIGTYTDEETNYGVYSCIFDEETGNFGTIDSTVAQNPSYLALSHDSRYLYAVNEFNGNGAVVKYKINEDDDLVFFDRRDYDFGAMCHISVSPDDRFLAVSCYRSGEAATLSADSLDIVTHIQFKGQSVNPKRQTEPHTHCAIFDKNGDHVIIADLGLDQLIVYDFDKSTGALSNPNIFKTKPGEGPRHLIFNAKGDKLYMISELFCSLVSYAYDDGVLTEIKSVPTIGALKDGEIVDGADIHFADDQNLIITSARQTAEPTDPNEDEEDENLEKPSVVGVGDSLSIFNTKDLTLVKTLPSYGECPRGFNIVGDFIVCANQRSGSVVSINIETGKEVDEIIIHRPTCVVVL